MTGCEFCGREFDTDRKLHLHWGEEHEEELNSHQEEKVKKAERKKKEEKQKKIAERKRLAGYGLAAAAALAVIGFVALQLYSGSGGPSKTIDTSGEPFLGDPNASVTVVEFGDYRCPVCKQFHEQVYPRLKKNYIKNDRIKFVFMSYSFLDQHFPGDTSKTASVAAECVYRQDKQQFWNMHNAIYNNQGPERKDWGTKEFLMSLARNHTQGLDYKKLKACINKRKTIGEVRSNRRIGKKVGVTGTPSIYINGKKMQSWRYSSLKSEIEKQLDQK